MHPLDPALLEDIPSNAIYLDTSSNPVADSGRGILGSDQGPLRGIPRFLRDANRNDPTPMSHPPETECQQHPPKLELSTTYFGFLHNQRMARELPLPIVTPETKCQPHSPMLKNCFEFLKGREMLRKLPSPIVRSIVKGHADFQFQPFYPIGLGERLKRSNEPLPKPPLIREKLLKALRSFDESMTRSDGIVERERPRQSISKEAPADVQHRTEWGDPFHHFDPSSGDYRKVMCQRTEWGDLFYYFDASMKDLLKVIFHKASEQHQDVGEAPADVQYKTEWEDPFRHFDASSGDFLKMIFHKPSEQHQDVGETPANVQYKTEWENPFRHFDASSGDFGQLIFHTTSEQYQHVAGISGIKHDEPQALRAGRVRA